MRGAERVVFALATLGEAGQAATLAQRADTVAPAGEDLVRVGLVADVPDHAVLRRLEQVMQRDRQLYDAKSRAEMATRDGHRFDRFLPQLVRDLGQGCFPEAYANPPASRSYPKEVLGSARCSLVDGCGRPHVAV